MKKAPKPGAVSQFLKQDPNQEKHRCTLKRGSWVWHQDNSFCALTRFQTFGATATNFVAKERTKETSRDRRVEPSLLDVARWHEERLCGEKIPSGAVCRGKICLVKDGQENQ